MSPECQLLTRRGFLAGAAAFAAWARLPRFAHAGSRDPRLLAIILRGAMDGLAAVPPVGDPDYPSLRQDIAVGLAEKGPALPLDGLFGLNPALANLHRMYAGGHAAIIHAAATPYRGRSHFDGQDMLESGYPDLGMRDTGWLNRALAALPEGERVAPAPGLAVGSAVPLVLRGSAPVLSWAPQILPRASEDTAARLMNLYFHRDEAMARALRDGLAADLLAEDGLKGAPPSLQGLARAWTAAATGAAKLMAKDDGPRIAALSLDGWDTHADQGAHRGRLANLFGALDQALAGIETELAPVWSDTVVLVLTEFGRTARPNGTMGTDHGTATVALVLGGAVRGGRVLGDWPGLRVEHLHEERDLKPTTDLRAVLKGVLHEHLGLPAGVLARHVFPGSSGVQPISGMIA